ncbi:hypothetical protein SEA_LEEROYJENKINS_59 [Microbacterium phage LeeroyJenkins]|nr:hypothetical protein SEA_LEEROYJENKINS_59 [Microbacterium phage LeeroyJenkins]
MPEYTIYVEDHGLSGWAYEIRDESDNLLGDSSGFVSEAEAGDHARTVLLLLGVI